MKAIISIMIIVIGVLVFFVVGNESTTIKTAQYSDQSAESFGSNYEVNDKIEVTASSNKKAPKTAESTEPYPEKSSNNNQPANGNYSRYESTNSSYYKDSSTYEAQSSSYGDNSASYNQDSSYYSNNDSLSNNDSSYSQNSSNNDNNSSTSQIDSNTISDNQNSNVSNVNESSEVVKTNEAEEATQKEDSENLKYQRLFDNGIMWYGNTGTLMIEYESSHAQTTGIGFRVHFDSKAIRPINVTQFPVDAIITTTPNTIMEDKDNRDNNVTTDSFLPFAWASIYGQWPQTNELNLASIDFEKIDGGTDNYIVNYSAISVPAGFKLIQ